MYSIILSSKSIIKIIIINDQILSINQKNKNYQLIKTIKRNKSIK
jgi:hypothetical protein